MGSLSSTPKSISQQVAAVPVAVAAPTTTIAAPATAQPSDAQIFAKDREKSLLARKRSRFGTIATSFQGILSNATSGARKTLLGE